MPRFRPRSPADSAPPADPRQLFDDVFRPGHFRVGPDLHLVWRFRAEVSLPWEIYQGRLLGAAQTREQRSFLAWDVTQHTNRGSADRPLIALLWDPTRQELHVVRSLLCHVWESYDDGGNVIQSRETCKWIMELVGTLTPAELADAEELRDEVICRIWQAVVGTSRLPLTSLEAPLPAFSLGQLAYTYRGDAAAGDAAAGDAPADNTPAHGPMRSWRDVIECIGLPNLAWRERARLLESVLRAAPRDEIADVAARCLRLGVKLPALMRTIFNEVSLSPWTGFADNALAFVHALGWSGIDEVGFLSWLIRKLVRHLTAYDLVTFHHRGANYPDALLLDTALKRLLDWAKREPHWFLEDREDRSAVPARRALRQGALLRWRYEGHAVPDAPTSSGENARVLPEPFQRVPDEQIVNPARRARMLFAGDPLARRLPPATQEILQRALADLLQLDETADLGTAVFVDRPFGFGKETLAPDQTPLLAHETFSPAIVERRLDELTRFAAELRLDLPHGWQAWRDEAKSRPRKDWRRPGLPIDRCASTGRPVAALADARAVSADIEVVGALEGSIRAIRELFDWSSLNARFPLAKLWASDRLQCVRRGNEKHSCLAIWEAASWDASNFDPENRDAPRILFESDPSLGYRSRGGVELPVAGLRIWQVLDDAGRRHDLRQEQVVAPPRW
ncbi:MAG: hypothetical protein L0Y71_03015 [Gemmataceae bacterium]|nr:hypothetical protein [Gemmataceae bacterium]